jgi:hypothetical protein
MYEENINEITKMAKSNPIETSLGLEIENII